MLPFKNLGSVRFIKCLREVSYADRGYIYLIQKKIQQIINNKQRKTAIL